jgi:MFS family permease
MILPRVALTIFGGVAGDRVGARKVMLISDAVMIVVAVVLAIFVIGLGTPVWLLLVAATLVGIVDAFYLPSSGSMPRRLLAPALLPRGLALQSIAVTGARVGGTALGGGVIVVAGIAGAGLLDAATFAVMFLVLLLIRPRHTPPSPESRPGVFREAIDGLRLAAREPLLRTLLVLVACGAGFLLPVASMLVPLLAREHGWSASQAALVVGAQGLGTVVVAGYVLGKGALTRPGLAAAAGLLASGLAVAVLGLASQPGVATVVAFAAGVGLGVFTTHMAPLVLGGTPDTHLSRVQATLLMAQFVPLLATNNLLGWTASAWGASAAIVISASVIVLVSALALMTPSLRNVSGWAAAG